jgi:hypothetical protein
MTIELRELLERNKSWAERMRAEDPEFFKQLSMQQAPKLLWIGCSDSRGPPSQVKGLAARASASANTRARSPEHDTSMPNTPTRPSSRM